MEIVLVAAVAENGVIGRDNTMPWRLKSDLQHFRARTSGRPVIMGRWTYISIGRALPARTNIVVSRDPGFSARGVLVAPSIEAALAAAHGDALRRAANEIIILGGSKIYAALMARADRLDITRVHASPDGDAFFPPIDPEIWREIERTEHAKTANDSAAFTWVTYRRRDPASRVA